MDHKLPTDNGPEQITSKQVAAFGVVFGSIGTVCAALQHDLGWTLVGLGATLINLMSVVGVFDIKSGE